MAGSGKDVSTGMKKVKVALRDVLVSPLRGAMAKTCCLSLSTLYL